MNTLMITNEKQIDEQIEVLGYVDSNERPAVHLKIDLRRDKNYRHFYLDADDARELAKKIIELI